MDADFLLPTFIPLTHTLASTLTLTLTPNFTT